ncbi:MAG TPA: acyl-CoA thioesterase [Cyclobacteriaceae bacterium]
MDIKKFPSLSVVYKTEVVCPNDTNPMGILQGGRLVQWMDIAAAVCAQIHSNKICVTASIDAVSFMNPASVGNIISIEAKICRAFTSSMEILVKAWSRNVFETEKQLISESFFTFVALDEGGKPTAVIHVNPVTSAECEQYEMSSQRKKIKDKHKTP